MTNSTSTTRLVAFIALGYALLGAAGLTMAIPPGYASPVFPAAGLALACVLLFGRRALFGVWLGSALLNYSPSLAIWKWRKWSLFRSMLLFALIAP